MITVVTDTLAEAIVLTKQTPNVVGLCIGFPNHTTVKLMESLAIEVDGNGIYFTRVIDWENGTMKFVSGGDVLKIRAYEFNLIVVPSDLPENEYLYLKSKLRVRNGTPQMIVTSLEGKYEEPS